MTNYSTAIYRISPMHEIFFELYPDYVKYTKYTVFRLKGTVARNSVLNYSLYRSKLMFACCFSNFKIALIKTIIFQTGGGALDVKTGFCA
jgi:hypothetical protein